MANRPLDRVEAREQFRTFGDGLLKASPCNTEDVRQGHTYESFGGGEWHSPRHVANGVVLNTVNGQGGIGMGCLLARGDAAALP